MSISLMNLLGYLRPASSLIRVSQRNMAAKMSQMNKTTSNWQNTVKNLDPKQVQFFHSEKLIQVDENDHVLGSLSKGEAHAIETVKKKIYHRALSLLIFDNQDRFLLTQRASGKITFPNYFTNACCSHPLYNEREMEDDGCALGVKRAVIRRSEYELGIKDIQLDELKFVNRLAYRAESDGGIWGEAEVDYIFILHRDVELKPNPDEVQSYSYVTREQMRELLNSSNISDKKVTPWVKLLARDFLFKYWDNLNSLTEIADLKSIVAYKDLYPCT